ncbi:MAG: hypothetical protein HOU81_16220 [Hamadaea sp.]|uniref:hypothetical protein n=1 Tax=Hamadaea sp. TaxID=2024425 RepID=UPI00181DED6E|nr:hypothetical protein [Hamadaea sp.]NUR72361.1 hypothetical protein [Hamadaea sp.]NUT20262.1 hypothetical protein [Hamadaea sp.]
MSYDLIFARLAEGQSWEDFLAAEPDGADAPLDPVTWRRVVQRVREILPGATESGDELDHEETAIQLYCQADTAQLHVPYWYTGDAARRVVTLLYRVAAVVAEEAGLTAFDPQVEAPVTAQRIDDAVAAFDSVAASFAAN